MGFKYQNYSNVMYAHGFLLESLSPNDFKLLTSDARVYALLKPVLKGATKKNYRYIYFNAEQHLALRRALIKLEKKANIDSTTSTVITTLKNLLNFEMRDEDSLNFKFNHAGALYHARKALPSTREGCARQLLNSTYGLASLTSSEFIYLKDQFRNLLQHLNRSMRATTFFPEDLNAILNALSVIKQFNTRNYWKILFPKAIWETINTGIDVLLSPSYRKPEEEETLTKISNKLKPYSTITWVNEFLSTDQETPIVVTIEDKPWEYVLDPKEENFVEGFIKSVGLSQEMPLVEQSPSIHLKLPSQTDRFTLKKDQNTYEMTLYSVHGSDQPDHIQFEGSKLISAEVCGTRYPLSITNHEQQTSKVNVAIQGLKFPITTQTFPLINMSMRVANTFSELSKYLSQFLDSVVAKSLSPTNRALLDPGRSLGTFWGPCIADYWVTQGNNTCSMTRPGNFNDLLAEVPADAIPLCINNINSNMGEFFETQFPKILEGLLSDQPSDDDQRAIKTACIKLFEHIQKKKIRFSQMATVLTEPNTPIEMNQYAYQKNILTLVVFHDGSIGLFFPVKQKVGNPTGRLYILRKNGKLHDFSCAFDTDEEKVKAFVQASYLALEKEHDAAADQNAKLRNHATFIQIGIQDPRALDDIAMELLPAHEDIKTKFNLLLDKFQGMTLLRDKQPSIADLDNIMEKLETEYRNLHAYFSEYPDVLEGMDSKIKTAVQLLDTEIQNFKDRISDFKEKMPELISASEQYIDDLEALHNVILVLAYEENASYKQTAMETLLGIQGRIEGTYALLGQLDMLDKLKRLEGQFNDLLKSFLPAIQLILPPQPSHNFPVGLGPQFNAMQQPQMTPQYQPQYVVNNPPNQFSQSAYPYGMAQPMPQQYQQFTTGSPQSGYPYGMQQPQMMPQYQPQYVGAMPGFAGATGYVAQQPSNPSYPQSAYPYGMAQPMPQYQQYPQGMPAQVMQQPQMMPPYQPQYCGVMPGFAGAPGYVAQQPSYQGFTPHPSGGYVTQGFQQYPQGMPQPLTQMPGGGFVQQQPGFAPQPVPFQQAQLQPQATTPQQPLPQSDELAPDTSKKAKLLPTKFTFSEKAVGTYDARKVIFAILKGLNNLDPAYAIRVDDFMGVLASPENNEMFRMQLLINFLLAFQAQSAMHRRGHNLTTIHGKSDVVEQPKLGSSMQPTFLDMDQVSVDDLQELLALILSDKPIPEDILQRLSSQKQDTVTPFEFCCMAANAGNVDALKDVGELRSIVQMHGYKVFSTAAEKGQTDCVAYLGSQFPDLLQFMLSADNFAAYRLAASQGHLNVVKYCLDHIAPAQKQKMLMADDCQSLRMAITNGHKDVAELLLNEISLSPEQMKALIQQNNFALFAWGAGSGSVTILKRLASYFPDEIPTMIQANRYAAFRYAAKHGHVNMLEYLIENAEEKAIEEMLTTNECEAFHAAAYRGHTEVCNYLLQFPSVFKIIEKYTVEYGERYIEPFIQRKLNALKSRTDTPSTVHSKEEAMLCVYFIRYWIRTCPGPDAVRENIQYLLNIPAVKDALAKEHLDVLPETRKREEWKRCLAEINPQKPTPPATAVQNPSALLVPMPHGGAEQSLEQIARNRESSMDALTSFQTEKLALLKQQYPIVDVETQWIKMSEEITALYKNNPATFECVRNNKSTTLELPATWEEFESLCKSRSFTALERTNALKQYYKHPVHTALRFLMKPNPWLSPDSHFSDPYNHCALWRDHRSLIIQLWLAAKDENAPPPADEEMYRTVEDRVEEFLRSLALINRAHNWDNTRSKTKRVGESTKVVQEEYDDEEGDKTSCYMGMLQRLMDSVKGHPHLEWDPRPYVSIFIRQHVRDWMEKMLNDPKVFSTKKLEAVVLGHYRMIQSGDTGLLEAHSEQLNASPTTVAEWRRDLQHPQRTGGVFDKELPLKPSDSYLCHFMHFDLEQLLKKALVARKDAFHFPNKHALLATHPETGEKNWLHLLYGDVQAFVSRFRNNATLFFELLADLKDEEQLIDAITYLADNDAVFMRTMVSNSTHQEMITFIRNTVPEIFQRKALGYNDLPNDPRGLYQRRKNPPSQPLQNFSTTNVGLFKKEETAAIPTLPQGNINHP